MKILERETEIVPDWAGGPKTRAGLKLSEEEFYAQEGDDSPYEYLAGELVVREPVSYLHEELRIFVQTLFRTALDERGGAQASGAPYPMRLDPTWSPEPDLMVVGAERLHLMGMQRMQGPADLVIEIASPSDPGRALRLKLPRYREARLPEFWVMNPYQEVVRVERLHGEGYQVQELHAGRLSPLVLPWFWIEVSWLWQRPLPSVLACLRQILA